MTVIINGIECVFPVSMEHTFESMSKRITEVYLEQKIKEKADTMATKHKVSTAIELIGKSSI